MSHAVTKIELLDDGKRVNLHFGRVGGSTQTVDISQIKKLAHERTLVETFEESSMFPIEVNNKTFYINGNGQEAVKNGEVFRAILNGQCIKL